MKKSSAAEDKKLQGNTGRRSLKMKKSSAAEDKKLQGNTGRRSLKMKKSSAAEDKKTARQYRQKITKNEEKFSS